MWLLSVVNVVALVVATLLALVTYAPRAAANTATCTSTVGPGIPPPASLPAGIPGFHATWYGQSGYMTLCPGDTSVATVAYYNTGSPGWGANPVREMAYPRAHPPRPGAAHAHPPRRPRTQRPAAARP